MGITGGGSGVSKGLADGFVVRFFDVDTVIITSGEYEGNGKKYTLSTDINYDVTTLDATLAFHYIYIDDSASTPPIPVFIDSKTTPAFDPIRRGYYNGDDRLVGVIFSELNTATIEFFDATQMSDHLIRNTANRKVLAAGQGVNGGVYQTPNVDECSKYVPVNAVEAMIFMQNGDPGGNVELSWRNNEAAVKNTVPFTAPGHGQLATFASIVVWDALGVSRNIKIATASDDDNSLFAAVKGYGHGR